MIPKKGKIYGINYGGQEMECVYLGKTKKKLKNDYLLLLNISPESERIPLYFPILGANNLEAKNDKILFSAPRGIIKKLKWTDLEQKFLDGLGKKYWEWGCQVLGSYR